jgi:hypothetical protein
VTDACRSGCEVFPRSRQTCQLTASPWRGREALLERIKEKHSSRGPRQNEMKYLVKFRTIEIFEAPKWVRRLSECTGLGLSLIWFGYVAWVSVVNHLGWPERDEQLDIASVAILAFAAGWVCVRICFGLIRRAPGRMVSNR